MKLRAESLNCSAHGVIVRWTSQAIIALGTRVGVRCNEPESLERLLATVPRIWKRCSWKGIEREFSLRVGEEQRLKWQLFDGLRITASSEELESVLDSFERQLKLFLAERARGRVFVHAGVVGWQGKAIIVPGRSHSGKTNLVAALVRAGATYYSDEYAVLDQRGRVHPYPVPLEIRQNGSSIQKRYCVEELGGKAGTRPLQIGLVLVSRYKHGARWYPSQLSPGRGMLELLANTIPARRNPEAVIATLEKALAGAVTLKSERGDAKQTARMIFDQIAWRREQLASV